MFFGKDDDMKGNPPPILHLSAYGDHMFDKVPVIINTFNVELRAGIDYISTRQDPVYSKKANAFHNVHRDQFDPNAMEQTWAPTLSNISVLVTPIYSRDKIKNFNLKDFSQGKLRGKDRIGFI